MEVPVSRKLRLGLLFAPALSCILGAAPAGANATIRPEALGYYNACMRDASASSNAIQTVGRTVYTCWGSVAESYFDYLVSTDAKEIVDRQRTGTYIFREIPEAGRCWHKIQTADGVSAYGCSLNVTKALN
jgi:hypothetical protein